MSGALPNLSKGFFQRFVEGSVPSGFNPVLQVMESRAGTGPSASYRIRLSDGLFSYSFCGLLMDLNSRFEMDGLDTHNAIIRVTQFTEIENMRKRFMTIQDYEVLSLDMAVIGTPRPHSGNPSDYQGSHMLIGDNSVTPTSSKSAKRERAESPGYGGARKDEPERKRQPVATAPNPARRNEQQLTNLNLITPFINKWRICGLVSGVEDIRDIKNPRGNFRVFGFNLTDKDGNSIRVSAFGEQADLFHPVLVNGKAYYVSGGGGNSVKAANKKFNSTGHDYELVLSRESQVEECEDFGHEEPKFKIHAVPLNRIFEHVNECIDVLAVIDRAGDLTQVTTRAEGKQLDKREISLVDHNASEVTMTLWGEEARDFDIQQHVRQVVGIKGAIVKEFNGGLSLSTTRSTQIKYNPEGPKTNALHMWYKRDRPNAEIQQLSRSVAGMSVAFERDIRLIGMASQHAIIGRDGNVYINVLGLINNIKTENVIYKACPTEKCKKKVSSVDNGRGYRCEKCDKTYDNYKPLFMLSVEIADISGSVWVSIFDEVATPLLGYNATQMEELQERDVAGYNEVFEKIRFKHFNIRCGVKYEMYNDQQQMRFSVVDIKQTPIEQSRQILMTAIQEIESASTSY